jgi:CTP-dependent riboflavin kinase
MAKRGTFAGCKRGTPAARISNRVRETKTPSMAIRINGTVIAGDGTAARHNAVLIPLLAEYIPEIANSSQFGTINVRLDGPLDKSRADVWTRRIIWQPLQRTERRLEAFGFINIKFECPLNGPNYNCWIMLPEGSRATYCADKAEIIADVRIEGVVYGANCALEIRHTPSVAAPPGFGLMYGMSFH